jgi:hypothetical protein
VFGRNLACQNKRIIKCRSQCQQKSPFIFFPLRVVFTKLFSPIKKQRTLNLVRRKKPDKNVDEINLKRKNTEDLDELQILLGRLWNSTKNKEWGLKLVETDLFDKTVEIKCTNVSAMMKLP